MFDAVGDGLVGCGEQFVQRAFQASRAVRGLEQDRQRDRLEAGPVRRAGAFPVPRW